MGLKGHTAGKDLESDLYSVGVTPMTFLYVMRDQIHGNKLPYKWVWVEN